MFAAQVLTVLVATTCGNTRVDEIRPWQVYELAWEAQTTDPANSFPYVEGLPDGGPAFLTATFRRTSGDAAGDALTVSGFWDGGRTWRIRFAPPTAGTWSYTTSSPDPGLDGHRGEFRCVAWTAEELAANPTRHGFVQVARSGPRAHQVFQYADGTPMFWLGDTWWNWTDRRIPFARAQHLVDTRAAQGFNVGQLFYAASGWGRDSSLLDRKFQAPDLEHIHNVERMITYANSKGITVWVHGWWVRTDMHEHVGAENIRRWTRYMVHRLGAFNVIWVLAGEYNMYDYGGLGLEFWKELGQLIDREDPYDRAIGAHPTPPAWDGGDAAPQWSTAEVLAGERWLDYHQSQVGHGRWRNEMIPQVVRATLELDPAKPIVVTEPWYEFVEGNPTAADIRFGGWSAVLSGAAGHSYGGGHVWRAHVPEAPARGGDWPLQLDFSTDTLEYAGARSLGFLADFMRHRDWWQLAPHAELLHDNPSPYCAADPGREYVTYLRWGGSVRLDLRPSTEDDQFEFTWIDLTTEQPRRSGTVAGGALRWFSPPEGYPAVQEHKDWLLHVRRHE